MHVKLKPFCILLSIDIVVLVSRLQCKLTIELKILNGGMQGASFYDIIGSQFVYVLKWGFMCVFFQATFAPVFLMLFTLCLFWFFVSAAQ